MQAVFSILFVQVLMGAFDNLWHHELSARLPQRASARRELALHAAREAIYAALFLGLASLRFHGAWVLLPATLLVVEVGITCADFLEEDRSRRLPPPERVLHTLLAVSYGILLGVLAPVFAAWARMPTALPAAYYGAWSWFFGFSGLAVGAWSLRNALAVRRLPRQGPAAPARLPSGPAVLVTGGTGFIGSALVREWLAEGRRVIVHTRDPVQARRTFGPAAWVVDRLDDIPQETHVAAVVHLAGAPVLGAPWTAARRRVLLESRTAILRDVLQLMRRLHQPPQVLVSASAVGFYGVPATDEPLAEDAAPQPGRFQSDLCVALEHEARRAEALGVRVVRLRFGIVLGRAGGAYPGLALAARLGLGAVLAGGRQAVPWIHLEDAVALVRFALERRALSGPVNAVAPGTAPQARFAAEMASSFGRRALVRVPGWMLALGLGEMSELLRCGQWAVPTAAMAAGYSFRLPTLRQALRELAQAR